MPRLKIPADFMKLYRHIHTYYVYKELPTYVDITKVKNIVTWSIFTKPEKDNRYLNCSFLKAVEMSRFLSFNLSFRP